MPKPTLYGGRWKTLNAIGQGGQAQVFLAIDTSNKLEGEFALKRLINSKRRGRFDNEIAAIRTLSHPNVVALLDHSGLDPEDGDTPFIVMPLARGGDLSTRAVAFKGAVDATITVALQLSGALEAAHAMGIVHRDLKPANVLFVDSGLNIWLADFGICLLTEAPRNTEDNEIVGPRAGFMAPECEDGGQLDVTPAADIYSLGKVIYFMLSGGRPLPREKLDDPGFTLEFIEGQRAHLLLALVRRMIVPMDKRITRMMDVRLELERIRDWRIPSSAAISERAMQLLNQHEKQTGEAERIHEENKLARQFEKDSVERVRDGFDAWVTNELEQVATAMRGGLATTEIVAYPHQAHRLADVAGGTRYDVLGEWRLVYTPSKRDADNQHVLRIYLCEPRIPIITTIERRHSPLPRRLPARDLRFFVMSGYFHMQSLHHPSDVQGYFSNANQVGSTRMRVPITTQQAAVEMFRIERVMREFHDDYSQHLSFGLSQWPSVMDTLHSKLGAFVEAFVEEIRYPSPASGY